MKALLIVVITVVVINTLSVVFAYRRGCALEEKRETAEIVSLEQKRREKGMKL